MNDAGHGADGTEAFVTLLTTKTSFEAHTVVAVLDEHGIEASVVEGPSMGAGLPLGGAWERIPVRVRAADLEAARRTLRERDLEAGSVSWDDVDVGRREDDLPLTKPGRMPLAARLTFVVAVVLVAVMIAGAIVLLT